MFRRMRPDIAHDIRAAPHADPERLGKAVQRALRETERLQPFISEADIDGETCPMLLRARALTRWNMLRNHARDFAPR